PDPVARPWARSSKLRGETRLGTASQLRSNGPTRPAMLLAFFFHVHVVRNAVRTGHAMRKLLLLTTLAASTLACPQNTVPTASPPSIVSFTAIPTTLPPGGGAVTLSWQVTGATGLTISGDAGAVSPVTSGNLTTAIGASTTFTLPATNADGT